MTGIPHHHVYRVELLFSFLVHHIWTHALFAGYFTLLTCANTQIHDGCVIVGQSRLLHTPGHLYYVACTRPSSIAHQLSPASLQGFYRQLIAYVTLVSCYEVYHLT